MNHYAGHTQKRESSGTLFFCLNTYGDLRFTMAFYITNNSGLYYKDADKASVLIPAPADTSWGIKEFAFVYGTESSAQNIITTNSLTSVQIVEE